MVRQGDEKEMKRRREGKANERETNNIQTFFLEIWETSTSIWVGILHSGILHGASYKETDTIQISILK